MSNAAAIARFERKFTTAARSLDTSKATSLRLAAEAAKGAFASAPGVPHSIAGRPVSAYIKSQAEDLRVGWRGPVQLVNNQTQPHHIEQRDFVGPLTLPGIGFRMYAEHKGTHGKHFHEHADPVARKVAEDVFARQSKIQLARSFGG